MHLLYEHPLKEQIKVFLRIEQLFAELDRLLKLDKNMSMSMLTAVIRCLERPDLKSKLTNTLHQQHMQLKTFANNPDIEQKKLQSMLNSIEQHLATLRSNHTLSPMLPKANAMLKKFQAEVMSHGAVALIADPTLYVWQQMPEPEAKQILTTWRTDLTEIHKIITFTLNLVRQSQAFKTINCNSHFYSQATNLSNGLLVRLKLPVGIIPEFSASRHHVAIRFQEYNKELIATDKKIHKFDMSICI